MRFRVPAVEMHEVVADPLPPQSSSANPIEDRERTGRDVGQGIARVRGQLLHAHLDPGARSVAVRRRLARVEQEQQLDGLAVPAQLVRDFERDKAPERIPSEAVGTVRLKRSDAVDLDARQLLNRFRFREPASLGPTAETAYSGRSRFQIPLSAILRSTLLKKMGIPRPCCESGKTNAALENQFVCSGAFILANCCAWARSMRSASRSSVGLRTRRGRGREYRS